MEIINESVQEFLTELQADVTSGTALSDQTLLRLLKDQDIPLEAVIEVGEIPRKKYFQNKVQIHILNNIQNGHCAEDCGYCAQRKSAKAEEIPKYTTKSDEEILAEAKKAADSGAFRYCMVTAGRGPGPKTVDKLAGVIQKIKTDYKLEVCLSAGILKDADSARKLADAGLDRYNHNLNTSEEHYEDICTTHTYEDRSDTLGTLSGAGVSLCSGVIVGMGEKSEDLIRVARDLRKLSVSSIPVNFFIPVPGHEVKADTPLTPDYCLRVLTVFRLINPDAEVRMAAGREIHIKDRQSDGLRIANSLFVSGYLNVKGSNARDTLALIVDNGYEPDCDNNEILEEIARTRADRMDLINSVSEKEAIAMKNIEELRPYQK